VASVEEAHAALVEPWYLPTSERHIFEAAVLAFGHAVLEEVRLSLGGKFERCPWCAMRFNQHLKDCWYEQECARLDALAGNPASEPDKEE
jgi:hypothetical protein